MDWNSDEVLVFVVGPDAAARAALAEFLRAGGHEVDCLASTEELLRKLPRDRPACAVLDVELPGTGALELLLRLARRNSELPVVFLGSPTSLPTAIRALRAGGADFLVRPVGEAELSAAVRAAGQRARAKWSQRLAQSEAQRRVARLTPREREVLQHLLAGRLNKQIARALGISEKTIKVHRGRIMLKTTARSLAELVRVAERAGITPADDGLVTHDNGVDQAISGTNIAIHR